MLRTLHTAREVSLVQCAQGSSIAEHSNLSGDRGRESAAEHEGAVAAGRAEHSDGCQDGEVQNMSGGCS